jgi:hypothetical protein
MHYYTVDVPQVHEYERQAESAGSHHAAPAGEHGH